VPYGGEVTDRSVTAQQYGQFLIDVFEEWVRHNIAEVYVQMFDVALANWYMVHLLRQNRAPSEVMRLYATRDQEWQALLAKTGRNNPCPCGSGKKFKHCHGRDQS